MSSNDSSFGKDELERQQDEPAQEAGTAESPRTRVASPARHDVFVALRTVFPCAAVFFVAYLVMMAVSTAAIPDISIFALDYTHDQLKWRFWADALTYPVVLGSVLFGACMAFAAFRFLLIKMQATTYLSLPLPRGRIFATRVVVCVACMLVVIAVALGVSLALNVVAVGTWDGEAVAYVYVLVGLFACALTGFAVATIALELAGTQLEAVLFAASLLACVTVACWGLNALMDTLLVGNAAGEYLINTQTQVAPTLLASFAYVNPLLFFAGDAAVNQTFMVLHPVYAPDAPNWMPVIAWIVFSAVLVAVGRVLFASRRGEKAGMAGLCTPMTVVFGLVCGLAVFALAFTVFSGLNVWVGIIAGLALFVIVSLLLARGAFSGATTTLKHTASVLGAEAAVLVVVIALVAGGGFGWASKVPAAQDVQAVQVTYTGSPMNLGKSADTALADANSFYVSGSYAMSDEESIATVVDVHEQLIATGHAAYETNRVDFNQTVVPYDLAFTYQLKDGSTLKRYYDRATLGELAGLLALDDSEALSQLRGIIVSGDTSSLDDSVVPQVVGSMASQAFANGDIYLANALYEEPLLLTCTDEARAELMSALADDISKQSAADRYYPSARARGVLMFSVDGSNDVESFAYQMENALVYLTDSYPKTLAWLEDKGLMDALDVSVDSIERMSFEYYDPYAGMNDATGTVRSPLFLGYMNPTSDSFITQPDFGVRFETTEKDQIAELFPLMRNTYYLNGGGYLACCELKGGTNVYLVIPADKAPDWLMRQVK